jgi:hypothetical protein
MYTPCRRQAVSEGTEVAANWRMRPSSPLSVMSIDSTSTHRFPNRRAGMRTVASS